MKAHFIVEILFVEKCSQSEMRMLPWAWKKDTMTITNVACSRRRRIGGSIKC